MDLFEYFSTNHANLLFLIAGVAFVIELTVLGLSGLLFFFAVGCFITAILTSMGLISSWEAEVLSVGLLTSLSALVLWKPLKKFQSTEIPIDTSSDMSGREVMCAEPITKTQGAIRYSGINWPARLDKTVDVSTIGEGQPCIIINTDGNIMLVKPAEG